MRHQSGNQPVLCAEEAVDSPGRGARFSRHAADRECIRSVLLDDPLGSGEQRIGGALIVFTWPAHLDSISQRCYVTK